MCRVADPCVPSIYQARECNAAFFDAHMKEQPQYAPLEGDPPHHHRRCCCSRRVLVVVAVAVAAAAAAAAYYYYTSLSVPFDASVCPFNNANRMHDEPAGLGERTAQWLAPACQRALFCGAMPMLVLDRPCTAEDLHVGARGAIKHVAPVMISHSFRAVYVANPTSADYVARAVAGRYLGAVAANSTEISQHMRTAYFFFTFSERTQDRFFYAAEAVLAGNTNTSCEAAREAMHALTDMRPWEAQARVHSQAFLLSAEAGVSNKMIEYDWIEVSYVFVLFERARLTTKNRTRRA